MPLASALRLSVTLCSVPSQMKRQAVFFMFQLSSMLSIANSIQGHRLLSLKKSCKRLGLMCFPDSRFSYAGGIDGPYGYTLCEPEHFLQASRGAGNWIDGAAGKCLACSFLGKSHGVRNDGWKNDLRSRGKGRRRMLRGNGGEEGFIPKGTEQFIPIQIPMSLEFLNHYVNRRHLWFILMLQGVFHWSLDVKSAWWYRLPHLSSLRDMIFQLLKIMLFLIS